MTDVEDRANQVPILFLWGCDPMTGRPYIDARLAGQEDIEKDFHTIKLRQRFNGGRLSLSLVWLPEGSTIETLEQFAKGPRDMVLEKFMDGQLGNAPHKSRSEFERARAIAREKKPRTFIDELGELD